MRPHLLALELTQILSLSLSLSLPRARALSLPLSLSLRLCVCVCVRERVAGWSAHVLPNSHLTPRYSIFSLYEVQSTKVKILTQKTLVVHDNTAYYPSLREERGEERGERGVSCDGSGAGAGRRATDMGASTLDSQAGRLLPL